MSMLDDYNSGMKQKLSCRFLENHCIAADGTLSFCFSGYKDNKYPRVMFTGNYTKTVEKFISLQQQILYNLNENILNPCTNCPGLAKDYYPIKTENFKIKLFTFQSGGTCNLRCSYCVATKNKNATALRIDLPELFAEFKARDMLAPTFSCSFAAGEISINPKCEEICTALQICESCRLFSNSLVYNEYISALLALGKTKIIVSVDSGTRETFAKVKGVNAFDRVCDTLHRYGRESKDAIILKYILLPGINDNVKDIESFNALARDINCKSITISTDMLNTTPINEHTVLMSEYLWKSAKDLSILCDTNSYALAEKMSVPIDMQKNIFI